METQTPACTPRGDDLKCSTEVLTVFGCDRVSGSMSRRSGFFGVPMSESMKKACIAFVCLLCVAGGVSLNGCKQQIAAAQAKDEPRYVYDPQTFLLWEHGAPGALGD